MADYIFAKAGEWQWDKRAVYYHRSAEWYDFADPMYSIANPFLVGRDYWIDSNYVPVGVDAADVGFFCSHGMAFWGDDPYFRWRMGRAFSTDDGDPCRFYYSNDRPALNVAKWGNTRLKLLIGHACQSAQREGYENGGFGGPNGSAIATGGMAVFLGFNGFVQDGNLQVNGFQNFVNNSRYSNVGPNWLSYMKNINSIGCGCAQEPASVCPAVVVWQCGLVSQLIHFYSTGLENHITPNHNCQPAYFYDSSCVKCDAVCDDPQKGAGNDFPEIILNSELFGNLCNHSQYSEFGDYAYQHIKDSLVYTFANAENKEEKAYEIAVDDQQQRLYISITTKYLRDSILAGNLVSIEEIKEISKNDISRFNISSEYPIKITYDINTIDYLGGNYNEDQIAGYSVSVKNEIDGEVLHGREVIITYLPNGVVNSISLVWPDIALQKHDIYPCITAFEAANMLSDKYYIHSINNSEGRLSLSSRLYVSNHDIHRTIVLQGMSLNGEGYGMGEPSEIEIDVAN